MLNNGDYMKASFNAQYSIADDTFQLLTEDAYKIVI